MPGAVATVTATAVMPNSLATQFTLAIHRKALSNEYSNGEVQAAAQVTAERRRWTIGKRLTATALSDLQSFYSAQNGKLEAFIFYDLTVVGAVYDPTGAATTGRYFVCFDNDTYSHTIGLGRANTQFALIEVG